MFPPTNATGAI